MSNSRQYDPGEIGDQDVEQRPAYAGVDEYPVVAEIEFTEKEAEPIVVPVQEIEFIEDEAEPIVGRRPYSAAVDYPVTVVEPGPQQAQPIVPGSPYTAAINYPVTPLLESGAEQVQPPATGSPYAATVDYPVTSDPPHTERVGARQPYPGVVNAAVRAGDIGTSREATAGLTAAHRRLVARPRILADPVEEWGTAEAAQAFLERNLSLPRFTTPYGQPVLSRQRVSRFLARYKDNWVRAHRHIIKAAASAYDVPDWVLGGVAWTEVGGDPPWFDEGGVKVRQYFLGDPARTSFGPVHIQLNRAAEELGYDPGTVSPIQRRVLIWTLEDPQNNVFVVASHLRRFKEIDARGKRAGALNDSDVRLIGARYNRGAELSIGALTTRGTKLSYGDSLVRKRERITDLLRD